MPTKKFSSNNSNVALIDRVRDLEAELARTQSTLLERHAELAKFSELVQVAEQEQTDLASLVTRREAEIADIQKQKDALESEVSEQRAYRGQSDRQIEELQLALKDRERESFEKDKKILLLETRVQQLENNLTTHKAACDERDALKKAMFQTEVRAKSLGADLLAAQSQLEMSFQELAQLTDMLIERDGALWDLRLKLEGKGAGGSVDKRKSPFRYVALPLDIPAVKRAKKSRKARRELQLIEESGLFDAGWYLRTYPDVAEDHVAARNPALHYLKFGGFEGRNPGPGFDSQWYLETNPDVNDSGVNPLIHYVSMGLQEGRLPIPY